MELFGVTVSIWLDKNFENEHFSGNPRWSITKHMLCTSTWGSIHSQGPRHTKDDIKMVPVVSLFSTHHWEILALFQELR